MSRAHFHGAEVCEIVLSGLSNCVCGVSAKQPHGGQHWTDFPGHSRDSPTIPTLFSTGMMSKLTPSTTWRTPEPEAKAILQIFDRKAGFLTWRPVIRRLQMSECCGFDADHACICQQIHADRRTTVNASPGKWHRPEW